MFDFDEDMFKHSFEPEKPAQEMTAKELADAIEWHVAGIKSAALRVVACLEVGHAS